MTVPLDARDERRRILTITVDSLTRLLRENGEAVTADADVRLPGSDRVFRPGTDPKAVVAVFTFMDSTP